MRTTVLLVAGLSLIGAASAHAQRRMRVGLTYSSLSLEDLSGSSHSFSSFGGSAVLLTGDDGETGLTIARYNDLATDGRVGGSRCSGSIPTTIPSARAAS